MILKRFDKLFHIRSVLLLREKVKDFYCTSLGVSFSTWKKMHFNRLQELLIKNGVGIISERSLTTYLRDPIDDTTPIPLVSTNKSTLDLLCHCIGYPSGLVEFQEKCRDEIEGIVLKETIQYAVKEHKPDGEAGLHTDFFVAHYFNALNEAHSGLVRLDGKSKNVSFNLPTEQYDTGSELVFDGKFQVDGYGMLTFWAKMVKPQKGTDFICRVYIDSLQKRMFNFYVGLYVGTSFLDNGCVSGPFVMERFRSSEEALESLKQPIKPEILGVVEGKHFHARPLAFLTIEEMQVAFRP